MNAADGQVLAGKRFGPLSRTTLALFAGASGDHNPMHIDIDFARKGGMEDVFVHGMLSMALLGRFLTEWAGRENLVRWGARFTAITPVNATLICRAIDAGLTDSGNSLVTLEVVTDSGFKVLTGFAELSADLRGLT